MAGVLLLRNISTFGHFEYFYRLSQIFSQINFFFSQLGLKLANG
jgi:hypothetical protein